MTDGDRALHSGLALLVLAAGLLGLLCDSWLIPHRHPGSLHALFGALLLIFVAACFGRHVRRTPRIPPADIRAFSRRLSQTVYLLLYVLMFFDLIIGILPGTPHRSIDEQAVQFQSYLASGVLALVAIRALCVVRCAPCTRISPCVIGAAHPSIRGQRNGRLT